MKSVFTTGVVAPAKAAVIKLVAFSNRRPRERGCNPIRLHRPSLHITPSPAQAGIHIAAGGAIPGRHGRRKRSNSVTCGSMDPGFRRDSERGSYQNRDHARRYQLDYSLESGGPGQVTEIPGFPLARERRNGRLGVHCPDFLTPSKAGVQSLPPRFRQGEAPSSSGNSLRLSLLLVSP